MSGDAHGHGSGGGMASKVLGFGALALFIIILLNNVSCSINLGGGGNANRPFQPLAGTGYRAPSSADLGRETYQRFGPVPDNVPYNFSVTPSPDISPGGPRCRIVDAGMSADGMFKLVRRVCPD